MGADISDDNVDNDNGGVRGRKKERESGLRKSADKGAVRLKGGVDNHDDATSLRHVQRMVETVGFPVRGGWVGQGMLEGWNRRMQCLQ